MPPPAFFSCYGLNAGLEPRVYGIYATRLPCLWPARLHSISFWFLLSPPLYNYYLLYWNAYARQLLDSGGRDSTVFSVFRRVLLPFFWTSLLRRVDLYLHYVFVFVSMFCIEMCSIICKGPKAQLYMYMPVTNTCNSINNILYVCCLELTPSADTLAFGPNLQVQPLWGLKSSGLSLCYAW